MVYLIVEGTKDERHIQKIFPYAKFIITNGTRMNNRVKSLITQALTQTPSVYILSDPDDAGNALATMINRFFPTLLRIHLDPARCKTMNLRNERVNIGVEHAEPQYLYEALNPYLYRS